jgi:hypothetical protein
MLQPRKRTTHHSRGPMTRLVQFRGGNNNGSLHQIDGFCATCLNHSSPSLHRPAHFASSPIGNGLSESTTRTSLVSKRTLTRRRDERPVREGPPRTRTRRSCCRRNAVQCGPVPTSCATCRSSHDTGSHLMNYGRAPTTETNLHRSNHSRTD